MRYSSFISKKRKNEMASSPSHTSQQTIEYLKKYKINYITPEEWIPSSPDTVPMDYAIWNYLKRRLNKTIDELKKKSFYMSGEKSINLILIRY